MDVWHPYYILLVEVLKFTVLRIINMKFVGDDKNINEVSGADTSNAVPIYLFKLEQEKKQDAI